MRKWTWMVLVASGSLVWACGGDDSDDDDDSSTTTTGSGGDGGSGGTDPTTTTGGSGGSGGSDPTTSVGGSGGTSPTTTGSGGSTTGSGGSAGGGAGDSAGGAAGAAGADGSTGGPALTVAEACEASCAAQETSACADAYCLIFCEYAAEDFPDCEAEFIARETCWSELEGDDFDCETDYPFPVTPNCEDEQAAYEACVAG